MGGDQLTWGFELTVEDKLTGAGDELTGGGHTFNKACIYGGKINGDTNHHHQQVNIVQTASGRWTLDRQIFAISFLNHIAIFNNKTGHGVI